MIIWRDEKRKDFWRSNKRCCWVYFCLILLKVSDGIENYLEFIGIFRESYLRRKYFFWYCFWGLWVGFFFEVLDF